MKIKYNIITKEKVKYCKESFTIREAIDALETSGYRCVPVLDDSASIFKGNIYVQEIYRAIFKETATLDDSIMKLVEDQEVSIHDQASFFRIFTNIKKYPYLAVLNDENKFTGILTHANVMGIIEDSWGVKTGSYTLTISTQEYQGALKMIVTSLKKFTSIQSLMTLDNESTFFRRIIVTLPQNTSEKTLKDVIRHLEHDGFRVFDVEKI